MEVRLRIGERAALKFQEPLFVPGGDVSCPRVDVDAEVEEVSDRETVRIARRLKDVQPFDDQYVRLVDDDLSARDDVVAQVRVERCADFGNAAFHRRDEPQKCFAIVRFRKAFAFHEPSALQFRIGQQEPVRRHQFDPRRAGPTGQEFAQQPGDGRLADRDRARHSDDEGRALGTLAEEFARRAMQPLSARHIQVQEAADRQIDLGDLAHVERIAQTAELDDLRLLERLRGGAREFGPVGPAEFYERGELSDMRAGACLSHRGPVYRARIALLLLGEPQTFPAIIESMCGIVGYVGPGKTTDVLLGGLKRLEYRGYDSAGIAVIGDDGVLRTVKRSGKLQVLTDELNSHPIAEGRTGIGHTRWATHGGPTDRNAHPHLGDDGKLAVIHNGIIENFAPLKDELLAEGFTFTSDTDTEVAAVLLGREFRATGNLQDAFRRVVARLDGAFTLLATHQDAPGVVVGARRNSPLVIGLGEGENFLGSDVAAFIEHTRRAVAVGQDRMVTITPDSVLVTDFEGKPVEFGEFEVAWDASASDKGGWSSFMAKEISEQPVAVANTLIGRVSDGQVVIPSLDSIGDEVLAGIDRITIIACGTAAYAGMVGSYAIEKWARVPVQVELSHEFRYRDPVISPTTLVISISQSGETMDTLMAVKFARAAGARVLSICNTQGATIPRESDAVVYTHAGPEVAVASTKAFVAQITALYLFALHLARVRGTLSVREQAEQVAELTAIPAKLERVLESSDDIGQLARWMSDTRAVLFLGRQAGYPIALEGALKLKELAYIHAEGFAAGELKHGPIALIEPGQPVFVVVPSPRGSIELHRKVVSNIQEIRARGARVIAVAEQGDAAVLPFADEVVPIPLAAPLFEPLLAVVPLQIFAMELASAKGLDVDQPRNLAKSVTVE